MSTIQEKSSAFRWSQTGDGSPIAESILAPAEASLLSAPPPASAPELTPEERWFLLEWSGVLSAPNPPECIHAAFEAHAAATPEAPALVFAGETFTYNEVNQRANRLAHHLRRLGVGPDVLVGICLERSPDVVISFLAILKAGGAYVPLDPDYPRERLAYMLEDASLRVLITRREHLTSFPPLPADVLCLDEAETTLATEPTENPSHLATPDHLAYVIYTSGSTGRPKGVCVPHRAVVSLVRDESYMSFARDEVFLMLATVSFDVSTLEIWGPLLTGSRLVIYPPGPLSLADLGEFLREQRITTLWLTAGLFHQMVDAQVESLRGLRQLLAGGDVLSVPHCLNVLDVLENGRLINGYGPTEGTTFAACHVMRGPEDVGPTVSIGRPMAHRHLFILDEDHRLVPPGEIGELCIGGEGVARGYLNRPELTAERFIPSPFGGEPGARLYKSGDMVRLLPGGTLEFHGRRDNQVKIRGFRIELGEIETAACQHPGVEYAVALPCGDAQSRVSEYKGLNLYVVPGSAAHLDETALRQFLRDQLPPYMLPTGYVFLDSLPLNANGKIDKAALPALGERPAPRETAEPRSPLERQLVDVWQKLLDVAPVGIHDNFFELGGHSLLAMRMIDEVERLASKRITLDGLFDDLTVANLAEAIESEREHEPLALFNIQPGDGRHPFVFLHGDYLGGGSYSGEMARRFDTSQTFSVMGVLRNGLPPTLQQMAEHYVEALRKVQPHGPYLLGGFCNGACLAYEMACLLTETGEQVDMVLMIDPPVRHFSLKFLHGWFNAFAKYRNLAPEEHMRLLENQLRVQRIVDASPVDLLGKVAKRFIGEKEAPRSAKSTLVPDWEGSIELTPRELALHYWYNRAVDTYQPRVYPGHIDLVWARDSREQLESESRGMWRRVAREVAEHEVPGGHYNCMTAHVEDLGDTVRSILEAALTRAAARS